VLEPSSKGDLDQALAPGLPFELESLEMEHLMSQITLHGVLSPDHRRSAVVCKHFGNQ
jgi:hypothetical protein